MAESPFLFKELAPTQVDRVFLLDPEVLFPSSGGGGGSPSVAWDDITGKPATFPPSEHTHPELEAMIWFMTP